MLQNHAFEQAANDLLFFGIELRDSFKLQAEFLIGTALVFTKEQLV